MRLEYIDIHPQLKNYIEKIWFFEAENRLTDDAMKLIVPNGLLKLVIPVRNGLFGKLEGCQHTAKEQELTLIGICDLPSTVDAQFDTCFATIGVEFSPLGAYRFFKLKLSELRNKIYPLTNLLGNVAYTLEQQLKEADRTTEKINIVQRFLIGLYTLTGQDLIFDYCVSNIVYSKGTISVRELEKTTGYSARWLQMKFDEKLGMSPKSLCTLHRFHSCYQHIVTEPTLVNCNKIMFDGYYDQSHFIKDFKRYTGMSPGVFLNQNTDFDRIFYK